MGASSKWVGDLIDAAEDEGGLILCIRAPKVVLDLGFSNISLTSAVFKSIAVSLNNCSPLMKWGGMIILVNRFILDEHNYVYL